MTQSALSLWKGQTVHARYVPFQRRFAYDLVLIDLDIDRLDEAGRISALFSINRPNLFSFRTQDHGARKKDAPLRPWAEEMLQRAGVDLDGGAVRLITFPRHLFYKFAPLSVWYGYGPDGRLRGVIYEVNNTFGETHTYVAATGDKRSQHEAGKAFHVSPFFDVSGTYRFTLRSPGDVLGLVIENIQDDARQHVATLKARRLNANAANLLHLAFRNPLSTLGVTLGIHWQALNIWLRGTGYRRKPALPASPATLATPSSQTQQTRIKEAA